MSGDTALIGRWSALDRLHHEIETRVERRLHQYLHLQASEFYALTAVGQAHRATARQLFLIDVADRIGLSQSATSRLVARLRERGLVTTSVAAHDRRNVEVRLTPAGHEVLRRGAPILHRAVCEAVQDAGTRGGGDIDGNLLHYLREPCDPVARPRTDRGVS
ncbi:transcriptional regulator [Streptomyces spinoverrucosus]|uniref:Transcriptional regulator n=1 Tax=Streptomyces spinoverrucosus TaxID=284043 RepID=A0A4Y3VH16_9ACTN|nr:MarR family winged helix-turn-helix transcriptional regulator [Streptomyces spinoverrucosus]GEC05495.1 transcriptional regulator [Streptomyces spinoverrucosus]GHB76844.1 transcriptional regulator [Streptomyces spinoverrucosus]